VQGDFTPAKYYLQQVISKPANAEISETALQLLNYLISFEQETMQLAQSEGTSFEKVESLSKLWQCKEALAEIAKVNMDVLTKEQKSSLQYYQGMCLEEMGDKKAAVKSYVAAIKSAGNSDMARDANRRIFIVGHQDEENGESMRNVALQLNESLQDSSLDTLVAIADSMPKAPPAPEEPLLAQVANTTNKESTDTAITTTTMDTMDTLQTMDPIDTAMDTMDEMDTPQITQSEPKASYDTTDFLAFIENEVAAVEKEIAQNTPTLEPEDDAMDATKQEELIEEKAIKKEAPAPKKVTLYSPVRLTTKDGKAFYGILMTDKNAPIIKVQL
jgi:hypothetical protein